MNFHSCVNLYQRVSFQASFNSANQVGTTWPQDRDFFVEFRGTSLYVCWIWKKKLTSPPINFTMEIYIDMFFSKLHQCTSFLVISKWKKPWILSSSNSPETCRGPGRAWAPAGSRGPRCRMDRGEELGRPSGGFFVSEAVDIMDAVSQSP